MLGHTRSLNVFVPIALLVMTSVGLASCGGGAGRSGPASGGGDQITITPRPPLQIAPDLVVRSPSVTDSNPQSGGKFTLSVTVHNEGGGQSSATTLRFYLSTDARITTSDAQVGMAPLAGLAASGSSRLSTDLTAPSTTGMFFFGGCVHAVADESDTVNNCSEAVQVVVREPEQQVYPNLEVRAPTVGNSSPATGANFTLSATVSNTGDGEAAATILRF